MIRIICAQVDRLCSAALSNYTMTIVNDFYALLDYGQLTAHDEEKDYWQWQSVAGERIPLKNTTKKNVINRKQFKEQDERRVVIYDSFCVRPLC